MSAYFLDGVRAVFFDAVGTLMFPDPPAAEIYARVAAQHGFAIAFDDVRSRFWAAYRAEEEVDRATGWVTSEVREAMRWRRIVGESLDGVRDPETCFRELLGHFARPQAWRVAPDAPDVLQELLSRGIRLGVGSNYDARLLNVLEGIPDLAPLRDRAVISARVGFRKPAPEFFREMVRVAGCGSDEVLFVGDDLENDYEGAKGAGLNAVIFDPRNEHPSKGQVVRELSQLLE